MMTSYEEYNPVYSVFFSCFSRIKTKYIKEIQLISQEVSLNRALV